MPTYSTLAVIDSLLKAEEIDNTIEKISRNIKNNGGEIINIDRWGKKRLAYEVKKRQYGYYVEILFKAFGNIVKIIEREYELDENVLRYLTLKLDKKSQQYYESQTQKAKIDAKATPDIIEEDLILEDNNFQPNGESANRFDEKDV